MSEDWWNRPRAVSVLVDNDSWILPFAETLVGQRRVAGDDARLCRSQQELLSGGVALFLGCLNIVKPETLGRNRRNLVVHASDLPQGRGFSPWTWLVLEGAESIPVCLLDAAEQVDAGDIVYKEYIALSGKELVADLRNLIGEKTVELCRRFLSEPGPAPGVPQAGEPTYHRRRTPDDSELDPDASLRSQFNLLRTVDNNEFPAYFYRDGARYVLKIERVDDARKS